MPEIFHVYVIAAKADDGFKAPVKVGITRGLRARVGGVRTACPFPIDLYFHIDAPTERLARFMEQRFHQCQAQRRLHGEWFDLPPAEAATLLKVYMSWDLRAAGVDPGTFVESCSAIGWEPSFAAQNYGGAR